MNRLIWVSAPENLTFLEYSYALYFSKKIPYVRFVFLENDETEKELLVQMIYIESLLNTDSSNLSNDSLLKVII